jgi:leader peptidase (prepilin peptidase)/N-methyltransferase
MMPLADLALAAPGTAAYWLLATRTAARRGVAIGRFPWRTSAGVVAFCAASTADPRTVAMLVGLATAAVADARTGFVFRPLTTTLGISVLGAAAVAGTSTSALLGGLVTFGALRGLHAATGGRGIGIADARLAFGVGAGLGARAGLIALGVAFALGAVYGVALLALRRADRRTALPFAPFIAAGAAAVTLAGALP